MPDILDKFSSHCRGALQDACHISHALGSPTVQPEHLLYGIAKQRGSIGAELLAKGGNREPNWPPRLNGGNDTMATIPLTEESRRIIERAAWLSHRFGHRYIGTEHLLAGLLEQADHQVDLALRANGVSRPLLRERLSLVFKSTSKFPELAEALDALGPHHHEEGPSGAFSRGVPTASSMLDAYAIDLTTATVQRRIDPLVGREAEIDRVIHILSRRTKNNPLLLGDPGVGKTAIVEGLAQKIVQGKVPDPLHNRRIYQLDLGLLVAGSSYRGEFEHRLKQLIAEVKQRPEIVLFIDEIHTLVGAGSAGGSMDAANLMKPSLARGEIRCIGATTLEDYKRHLETDAALERRFQPILVNQPGVAETIAILDGLKPNYERYHGVTITEEAITAAATLADRYVHNKFLPDKAIDLLDEAAAMRKLCRTGNPRLQRIRTLEQHLAELEAQKRAAVSAEQFGQALTYRHQVLPVQQALVTARERLEGQRPSQRAAVTAADVQSVVVKITGMQLAWLRRGEQQQLQRLAQTLRTRVLGQGTAVSLVAQTIRRAKAGLANARRPLGSFLFLGPSGVGKSELARVLAQTLFPGQDALIQINMSEFSESFTISRLIGSPAGYVGYREGAQLTDQIRKRPHSVVLFDQVENAHPQILTILLQILEDGCCTDATGKTSSFRQAVIILTSNAGSEHFRDHAPMGFSDGTPRAAARQRAIEREVRDKLPEQFPIELLNRIDQVVVFSPLLLPTVARIAEIQLKELRQRLAEHAVTLRWSPAVAKTIATISYSPDQGARAVRRTITQLVEGPVANRLLRGKRPPTIHLRTRHGKLVIP